MAIRPDTPNPNITTEIVMRGTTPLLIIFDNGESIGSIAMKDRSEAEIWKEVIMEFKHKLAQKSITKTLSA